MDKYNVYQDMSRRTGGEIYLGIVGPVRTGKSTFIKLIARYYDTTAGRRKNDYDNRTEIYSKRGGSDSFFQSGNRENKTD